jgi:hypothetical protein
MPPIFKALASAAVWILFVMGCIAIVVAPVTRVVQDEMYGSLAAWAIGVACLILAVVAMKLRKTLE